MLFVLTGDIQTGKTRALCDVLEKVAAEGVVPFGVVAPGLWRDPAKDAAVAYVSGGFACPEADLFDWGSIPVERVDANGFEKLGITNMLYPQGETLLFGLRRDVAKACGRLVEDAQSERARLGWHMSDEAIAKVDAHFAAACEKGVLAAAKEAAGGRFDDAEQALLVVDELGMLELYRKGGLVSAMKLLDAGPTPECQHALVVVRSRLSYLAEERFADAWNGYLDIYPGTASPGAILGALRCSARRRG